MHLRIFIILVSFSVVLSSRPERDHEVLEKGLESFPPSQYTNQPKNKKMTENVFSLEYKTEEIKSTYSKHASKSNLHKSEDKRKRKVGKSIKADDSPKVSQLSDEIISKIRKLLENEMKEINTISKQRSNINQETLESISSQTSKPFQLETKTVVIHNNSAEISPKTKNQTSQESKLSTEKFSKKEGSLESANNVQIQMMELSRNGGIENNLSTKKIGKPSWRSELSDQQQTEEVNSGENIVYLKIYSSLEEPDSNLTLKDQESENISPSGDSDSELNNKQKNPIENIQSRTKEATVEPKEEDLIEAANYGMQAMNDLYYIKEPKLYSLGLFLGPNNPARYVANFNHQSDEARHLAKFGFAALEGSKLFVTKYPEIARESLFTRSTKHSALHRQCPRRGIPQCPPASLRYRTADGSCNNAQNLWWGSAMSTMQRFVPSVYQDGIQSIRRSVSGALLPSARQVSNFIHEDRDIPLASVSHMLMQWGQFVDHDITATGQSRSFNGTVPQCCLDHGIGLQPPEFMHPECLPITVHPRDSFFRPFGVRCLEFTRSGPAPREDCEFGPREQVSQVTSYLDASTVYGSNVVHSDNLRIFRNGLLQYGKLQSRKHMFARDDSDICQLGSLSQNCFRAGDGRLGENPALTSLHVVFLRLHNRIAAQIASLNPHWSEERMFQETRKIVGAIIQHITYREFLPIVLGNEVMKIFKLEILRTGYFEGYDPTVNPNVANEFAAAAYRFGHSLIQKSFMRFDRKHRPLFNNVTIHEEFFNPHLESAGTLDSIVLGLVDQPSQKRDEFISEELTNHLFQRPTFPFGMDLASLNIQRGRDHGIPPYVHYRTVCGLSAINNWRDLERVMEVSAARKFKVIYSSVDDIDLFPAGLSEKPVVGGLLGPTFACIVAQQFSNLKKGDRFWFETSNKENRFTPQQLQQIRSTTLAQILCKTMDNIESLQPFVMLLPDNNKNRRISCNDPRIGNININVWKELLPVKVNKTQQRHFVARGSVSRPENKKRDEERKRPTINQQNRIVLKRPIAPQDNISIIVHNFAVNAPVLFNDGIYSSHLNLNSPPIITSTEKPNEFFFNEEAQFYPTQQPLKPKPSRPSIGGSNPYIPQNFGDSNNPNPPNYGFSSKPVNNYVPNNAFFENLYNNNYRPNDGRPNYNQERPGYEGYQTRPISGSNQNSYNHQRPDQNLPNYNNPFSGNPSDHDNPNPPVQEGNYPFKPVTQNIPHYQRPVASKLTTQKTTRRPSSNRPIQNRPINKPEYSNSQYFPDSDYSEQNYKVLNPDSVSYKPVTLPGFTVITETLETGRFTENVNTTPKRKTNVELPRPLIPRHRIDDDSLSERAEIAGPGLHYFNKNILYKYPQKNKNMTNLRHEDELISEKELKISGNFSSTNKNKKLNNNSLVINYDTTLATNLEVMSDEIKFTTTPTIIIKDNESNPLISIQKTQDEEKDYADEMEAVVIENIDEEIENPMKMHEVSLTSEEIFPNLTISMEQPEVKFEFPTSEELPKPIIKLRNLAS